MSALPAAEASGLSGKSWPFAPLRWWEGASRPSAAADDPHLTVTTKSCRSGNWSNADAGADEPAVSEPHADADYTASVSSLCPLKQKTIYMPWCFAWGMIAVDLSNCAAPSAKGG
jgi:hypothetical protein